MLTAPQGFGTQHLHICCIQWILAAPGSLARKASPGWAVGASRCRVRADLLCTLQENGKGMAKLPGMTQQQKGFRKGNVPAPSTALAEVTGTETSSLLTARWHSLLQTIPFPKLGSKEHMGFHCSGADRPPFFADYPCARLWHPRVQAQAAQQQISPRQGQSPHRERCQHRPRSPSPPHARAVLAHWHEIPVTKRGQACPAGKTRWGGKRELSGGRMHQLSRRNWVENVGEWVRAELPPCARAGHAGPLPAVPWLLTTPAHSPAKLLHIFRATAASQGLGNAGTTTGKCSFPSKTKVSTILIPILQVLNFSWGKYSARAK